MANLKSLTIRILIALQNGSLPRKDLYGLARNAN